MRREAASVGGSATPRSRARARESGSRRCGRVIGPRFGASAVFSLPHRRRFKKRATAYFVYTVCCATSLRPLPPRFPLPLVCLPGRATVSSVSDPSENPRRRASGPSTWLVVVRSRDAPMHATASGGLSLSLSLARLSAPRMVNTSSDSVRE